MEVRITDVRHELSGNCVVAFDTYIGNAKATWSGEIPVMGREYAVEINVECKVTWGLEIKPSESETPKIWLQDDIVHAQGGFHILPLLAEDSDTTTIHYVQVGHWMFNLFDISDAPATEQPCVITVPHRKIWLYPYYI